MIYLETPANPTMQIHRIRTAADWARQHETEDHRMIVGVDNTYLGPILQRPLEHGADVLVYSATKYIGGHSDLIAGAASGKADAVARTRVPPFPRRHGRSQHVLDALRGMETWPFASGTSRT